MNRRAAGMSTESNPAPAAINQRARAGFWLPDALASTDSGLDPGRPVVALPNRAIPRIKWRRCAAPGPALPRRAQPWGGPPGAPAPDQLARWCS